MAGHAAAGLLTLGCLLAVLPFAAAAETDVQVCDTRWTHAARARAIPLRIHLPRTGQPVPVVLYSPGLGVSLEGGQRWAQAWAAAGIAVIQLQHPGSDGEALRAGRLREAASAEQFVARIEDVHFVIDALQQADAKGPCALHGIDPQRIGLAGHSMGALTTQAIAGQHFALPGAEAIRDNRVRAALALSPAPPTHGSAQQAFGSIGMPLLAITGTRDAVPGGRPGDREQLFQHLPPGDKWQLVIAGAEHAAFSGRADGRHPHAETVVVALSIDFWRTTLMGDEAARARLQGRPAVLAPADRWDAR